MSQLIKHYFINRDTGEWVIDTPHGYMMPNLKGLEIQYWLFTDNQVPYALSTVPEYFEHTVTILAEGLQDLRNTAGITIVSSTEIPVPEATEENPDPQSSYEVVYHQENVLEPSVGLQVLTQQQWDDEIAAFDANQLSKRLEVVRRYRDIILTKGDWAVIKSKETGEYLSADFKDWRQSLRDLPATNPFPAELPSVPENNEGVIIESEIYQNYIQEIRSIPMINDSLPPLEVQSRPNIN